MRRRLGRLDRGDWLCNEIHDHCASRERPTQDPTSAAPSVRVHGGWMPASTTRTRDCNGLDSSDIETPMAKQPAPEVARASERVMSQSQRKYGRPCASSIVSSGVGNRRAMTASAQPVALELRSHGGRRQTRRGERRGRAHNREPQSIEHRTRCLDPSSRRSTRRCSCLRNRGKVRSLGMESTGPDSYHGSNDTRYSARTGGSMLSSCL